MTDAQVKALIIERWQLEHDPQAIMLACICMGRPMRKADVMVIIRRWCDTQSENKTYRAKA